MFFALCCICLVAHASFSSPTMQSCVGPLVTVDEILCSGLDTLTVKPSPDSYENDDILFYIHKTGSRLDLWVLGPRRFSGNPPNQIIAWENSIKLKRVD